MRNGTLIGVFWLVVGCADAPNTAQTSLVEPPSSTISSIVEPSTTASSIVKTTLSVEGNQRAAWSTVEAEGQVINFLAALAAGAFEQAAWSAENGGAIIQGQGGDETGAEALERMCRDGACAGPYTVHADGPAVRDPASGQSSSTVTVTHVESGEVATMRLGTFEGQLIIVDLPPLVPSTGGPTLIEELFGDALPSRVVVSRFDAFEIWEDGESEWVTNWWAEEAYEVEGDFVAAYGAVVALHDPSTTYEGLCPRLMTRDGEVLVLEQNCDTSTSWQMFEVPSGESRPTPIRYEERGDGEFVWFVERSGTVIHGIGDAEGNLGLKTLQGVDLTGDDSAGYVALSTNGKYVAYVDHADPAAVSHFWSPVVVVKDTSTGAELGRWTLDAPVRSLEIGESWLVAGEADPEAVRVGDYMVEQIALVAIEVETGETNRVETPTFLFLPT